MRSRKGSQFFRIQHIVFLLSCPQIAAYLFMSLFSSLQRYFVSAVGFFLYPQSQYGPPEARVYSRTKSAVPPASAMV